MRLVFTPLFLIVCGIGLIALLATRRRERTIARLAWALFGITYLSSTAAPVGFMLRLWELPKPVECGRSHPGGTYVVLTGGASGAVRRSSDIGLLHLPTIRRLIAAIDLANQSPNSRLLISGGAEVGTVTEAQIAREFALRLGWAKERLIVEDRSFDTLTSAQEVAQIVQRDAIAQPVILVTSAVHMRRARFAYRTEDVAVLACPTDYVELFPIFPDSLLPDVGVLQRATQGWKEIAGLAVYAVRTAVDA